MGNNSRKPELKPLEKAAIFLVTIGLEKGRRVIALMDNSEINAVTPQIRRLTVISPEIQEIIWGEFKELGYEDGMNPVETLTIIRFLFDGSKICSPN